MRKIIIPLLAVFLMAFLAGCGKGSGTGPITNAKITQENFDKLKEGMTQAEVTAILGEPTGTEDVKVNNTQIKGSVWDGGHSKIVASFDNQGKLLSKRMIQ